MKKSVVRMMDPSLSEGSTEVFATEVPMEINSEDTSFEDSIMVRAFQNAKTVRLELTSQTSISFFYRAEFPHLISLPEGQNDKATAYLSGLFRDSEGLRYALTVETAESAKLKIRREEKYKFYELAELELELESPQKIQESLMYRYENMKAREEKLDVFWNNACNIVRTKNPSLLQQFAQSRSPKPAFK